MSSLSASISATDALPDPDTQRSIREPAMRSIDTLPEPLSATEDRAGVEMLSVTSPPGRSPGQPVQPERSGRTIRVRPCTVTLNRSSARRSPLARSEEHTSELQSLMRISYAVFCLKKKKKTNQVQHTNTIL